MPKNNPSVQVVLPLSREVLSALERRDTELRGTQFVDSSAVVLKDNEWVFEVRVDNPKNTSLLRDRLPLTVEGGLPVRVVYRTTKAYERTVERPYPKLESVSRKLRESVYKDPAEHMGCVDEPSAQKMFQEVISQAGVTGTKLIYQGGDLTLLLLCKTKEDVHTVRSRTPNAIEMLCFGFALAKDHKADQVRPKISDRVARLLGRADKQNTAA